MDSFYIMEDASTRLQDLSNDRIQATTLSKHAVQLTTIEVSITKYIAMVDLNSNT